jgi:hypothetical protein
MRYGSANVFLDLVDLAPGADWDRQLKEAVASADGMLVVIGPQWLTATDAKGQRRIDDPEDFIRSEIAAGLRLEKLVIPVLVGGASMPAPLELPEDLRALSYRQAVGLRDTNWATDVETLVRALDASMRVDHPAPAGRAWSGLMSRVLQAYKVLRGAPALDGTDSGATQHIPSPTEAPTPRPRTSTSSGDALTPPQTPQLFDVFVSHAVEDRDFADTVVRELEQRGRACWIAHRDIPPGVPSWAEPIVTAIARSRLMLVLLTSQSIDSVEVLREVTLADNEKIPLLPVSLDSSPMSPGLRYFFVAGQRLDVAGLRSADRLLKISTAVDRHLSASA